MSKRNPQPKVPHLQPAKWASLASFSACVIGLLGFVISLVPAAENKKVVIPFDFVSRFDDGRYGRVVGEMFWRQLSREKGLIVPESMLDVRRQCAARKITPSPDTSMEKMASLVCDELGGQIGVWGSVERAPDHAGDVYDLVIKCVDFSDRTQPKVLYDIQVRTKSVSEIPHLYAKRLVDILGGRSESAPPAAEPDPTVEANWKNNPNLVVGDFQEGKDGGPKGWDARAGQLREPLGRMVCWCDDDSRPGNKLIRFTLDRRTAENEGLMYYSDYFPLRPGAKYRFQCRWRSTGPAVKVFIKCYAYFSQHAERREVYRSQQNLSGSLDAWNTHTEDFTPQHAKYTPQWGRVMLYAYLKPGVVEFDDVVVKEIFPPSPGKYLPQN